MDAKYIQQFKKGSLEMMLLSLIAHGETYGYEILTALNETCADVIGYADGMTAIELNSSGFDPTALILITAAIAAAAAMAVICAHIRRKKETMRR